MPPLCQEIHAEVKYVLVSYKGNNS